MTEPNMTEPVWTPIELDDAACAKFTKDMPEIVAIHIDAARGILRMTLADGCLIEVPQKRNVS